MNKVARQQKILKLIRAKHVGTQQELARALQRDGISVTQSSVSRDIVELGLTKVNGYYAAVESLLPSRGLITAVSTAGDNLIVIKTDIGQAQPAALRIDERAFTEIVGTVAGDDTIFVAVKDASAQRVAMRKIVRLFARPPRPATTSTVSPRALSEQS